MSSKEEILARYKSRRKAGPVPYTRSEKKTGIPAVEYAIKSMEHQKMEEPEIREQLQDNGVPAEVVDNTYDNRERKLFKRTQQDSDVEIKEGGIL